VKQSIWKVLYIICITFVLSFSLSNTAMGSITLNSTVNYKYDLWKAEDIIDTILYFNGKINENANAYASIEYQSNAAPPVTGTAYFTYTLKPELGVFTVGCFYENLGNLNLLGNTIDHLKSHFGLKFERPIINGLSMKFGYYPHEQKNLTSQNVYLIGLGYKDEHYRAALNLVKFEDSIYPINYNASFLYMPSKIFRVYAHYGNKLDDSIDEVLGVMLSIPPTTPSLNLSAEYNFNKPDVWGVGINYIIDKNIIVSYYRTTIGSRLNELRLTISL
jgi:hypothetical protein